MNIAFRVDSSSKTGVGHLMRCLTLADELKSKNYQITFICRDLKGNHIHSVQYPVFVLPKSESFSSDDLYLEHLGASQQEDADQTIRVLPRNIDILIVDSYALNIIWHKKLRPYVKKILVIDDLANRQFDCDILLNQNVGSKNEDYKTKVPYDCKLLLGCDYALLQPGFSLLRKKAIEKRKVTKKIKNILISMGGSDLNNVTYNVLQQISDNYNVIVVLGSNSPHNEMIKSYSKNKEIKVIIETKNMPKLIFEADLGIGAGGSSSWERCCLGLPTLLYITAENQRVNAGNLEHLGLVKIVRNLKDDLQNMSNDINLWREMSEKSIAICDGLGVKRIDI